MVIKILGEMSTRNSVLGEGQVDEIPPLAYTEPESDDTISHVNWQGEVICTESVSVGGFSAGNVEVKVSDTARDHLSVETKRINIKLLGLHCSRNRTIEALQTRIPIFHPADIGPYQVCY